MRKQIPKLLLAIALTVCLSLTAWAQKDQVRKTNDELRKIATPASSGDFYKIKPEVNIKAIDLFTSQRKAFELSDGSEMILQKQNADNMGMSHYKFQQHYHGVPLEAAIVVAHEKQGRVEVVNGVIVPEFKIATNPSFTEANALNSALSSVGAKKYMWESQGAEALIKEIKKDPSASFFPKGELVVIGPYLYARLTKFHLAYKFDIFAASPQTRENVFVDAHTGEVLLKYSTIHTGENVNGTADTYYYGDQELVTGHFQDGFHLRVNDYQGSGTNIITLNANNTQPVDPNQVTDFIDQDNYWKNINPDIDEVAPDAHWGAQKTWDYYHEVHGRNSLDDNGHELRSYVHVGDGWFNASWNGLYMQYGDGQGEPLVPIDIVSHELTHGFTTHTSNLIYFNESGALNEAISDIFGIAVENFVNVSNEDDLWLVGDKIGAIRNMANPNDFNDPDTYFGDFWAPLDGPDNGGVHTNSGVFNFWFYLLSRGGSGTNDNNTPYNVESIGIEAAEKITYRTAAYYLTPSSGFIAARQASLQAAEDLYGICSNEYFQVLNAWVAVGVGGPLSANDVGIVKLVSPKNAACGFTTEEKVRVEIKYYGDCEATLAAGTEIPLTLVVDGNPPVQENLVLAKDLVSSDPLNNRVQFTFSQTVDLSAPGNHTITITSDLLGDDVDVNDELEVVVVNTKMSDPNDLTIKAVTSPVSVCDVLGSEEVIKVEITNLGCEAILPGEIIPMSYSVDGGPDVNENLILENTIDPQGGTFMYEFVKKADLSAPGVHTVSVSVDYGLDPNNTNNSLMVGVAPLVTVDENNPYNEDFENNNGAWSPQVFNNNYFVGGQLWQWGTPNQGPQFTQGGNNSQNAWMTSLSSNYSNRTDVMLESPCLDLTNLQLPRLSFDANFNTEGDWDGMIVEYSTDAGATWSKLNIEGYNNNNSLNPAITITPPWFSGNNGGWSNYQTYAPELAGKSNVKIRFHFQSDDLENAPGMAIDNVVIDKFSIANELALVDFVVPSSSCDLGAEEPLKVYVKNNGTNEELTFNIVGEINNVPTFDEEISGQFPYGETVEITLNTTADLSNPGDYVFDVTLVLANDEDLGNNEVLGVTTSHLDPETVIPFTEDFEGGVLPQKWALSQAQGSAGWIIGEYNAGNMSSFFFEIPQPQNGTFVAASNDDICNCDMSEDRLIFPPYDLPNEGSLILKFNAYFHAFFGASRAFVDVKVGGGEWTPVYELLTTDLNNWQEVEVDLSEYAGKSCVQIAFRHDDSGVWASGFAIDDVVLDKGPDFDAGVVDILNPTPMGGCLGAEEHVKVKIENFGQEAITNFDVSYSINGGPNVTEQVTATVQPGEIYEYTFTASEDLSNPVSYETVAFTALNGDANPNNDQFSVAPFIYTVTAPFVEDFEGPNSLFNASDDDIDWTVNTNGTISAGTGPSGDHTSGLGNYLYIEASGIDLGYPNKTANLLSPCYISLENMTYPAVEFWYHMYGSGMGTLSVDVYDATNDVWHNNVWTKSGDQGDQWLRGEIYLGQEYGNVIRLRFRGKTANDWLSDMAIDDLSIFDKPATTDLMLEANSLNGCDSKISIKNIGTEVVNGGMVLNLTIDGQSYDNIAIGETINPTEAYEYFLSTELGIGNGAHTLDIATLDFNDDDLNNNQLNGIAFTSYASDMEIFDFEEAYAFEGQDEMVTLDASEAFDNIEGITFEWNPESVFEGQKVDKPYRWYVTENAGATTFEVTVTFANGCSITDQVNVHFDPIPATMLKDTVVCGAVEVTPGDFESYLWNDLSTESTLLVTESGMYYVTVSDEHGRYTTYSAEITVLSDEELPSVTITENNGTLEATAGDSYQWYLNGVAIEGATAQTYTPDQSGDYMVMVTKGDCSKMSDVFTYQVETSVNEGALANAVAFYPNPTADIMNVEITSSFVGNVQITVIDLLGRVMLEKSAVKEGRSFSFDLSLANVPNGVHFLKVSTSEGEVVRKIVKE